MTNIRRLINLTERINAPSLFTPGGIRGLDGSYVNTSVRGGGIPDIPDTAASSSGGPGDWWGNPATTFETHAWMSFNLAEVLQSYLDNRGVDANIAAPDVSPPYFNNTTGSWEYTIKVNGENITFVHMSEPDVPLDGFYPETGVININGQQINVADDFLDYVGGRENYDNFFDRIMGFLADQDVMSWNYGPNGEPPMLPHFFDIDDFMLDLKQNNLLPHWALEYQLPQGHRWVLMPDPSLEGGTASPSFILGIVDGDGNLIPSSEMAYNPFTGKFGSPAHFDMPSNWNPITGRSGPNLFKFNFDALRFVKTQNPISPNFQRNFRRLLRNLFTRFVT